MQPNFDRKEVMLQYGISKQCLSDILKQKDAVVHKVDVTHGSIKVLKNVASLAADREWEDRLYRWLERTSSSGLPLKKAMISSVFVRFSRSKYRHLLSWGRGIDFCSQK